MLRAIWALLLLAACAPIARREMPPLDCDRSSSRPKLLFLAVDGVRSDAFEAADTPRSDLLAKRGVLRLDTRAVDIPKSGPGWSTVLTGVWRDRHGVDSNRFTTHRLDDHPHLIARLESADARLTTSFIHSWSPLSRFASHADHQVECGPKDRWDECAMEHALRQLSESDVDVLFLYFRSIDEIGHRFGFHPAVPEYVERISWVDRQIGSLIDRIEQRCTFDREQWLVLAVTDHGGGGVERKGHGYNLPVEREVFGLMARLDREAKPFEVFPAPAQTDFAPTALAHFGVPPGDVDGRVLAPGTRPRAKLGENLIFNGGAELDRGQLTFDADNVVSGWEESACAAPIAYGSPEGPAVDARLAAGKNLIAGASRKGCSIAQRIDVSHLELTGARYDASALLGGWSDQEDAARVVIRFDQTEIQLGPLTREARGDRTLLGRVAASGEVPPQTREIEVEIHFSVATGVGDGYADELSLVLTPRP